MRYPAKGTEPTTVAALPKPAAPLQQPLSLGAFSSWNKDWKPGLAVLVNRAMRYASRKTSLGGFADLRSHTASLVAAIGVLPADIARIGLARAVANRLL